MARKHGPFATANPWRFIGCAVALGLTVGTALVGFVLLPLANRSAAEPLWTAVCTALGLQERAPGTPRQPEPAVQYASAIQWTQGEIAAANGGDVRNGAFVATNCGACHGDLGVSAEWWIPSLAGMRPEALVKQLVDYRSGHRRWAVMNAIAGALSTKDMRDVAAFYGSLQPPPVTVRPGSLPGGGLRSSDPTVRLVYAGDPVRGIAPCASCHGLEGLKRAAPILAGQHPAYLERQLGAFRGRWRTNDEGEQMRVVAARLTDGEIRALAEYLAAARQ